MTNRPLASQHIEGARWRPQRQPNARRSPTVALLIVYPFIAIALGLIIGLIARR